MKRAVDPLERIAQLEKLLAKYRREYYRQRARALSWKHRALEKSRR